MNKHECPESVRTSPPPRAPSMVQKQSADGPGLQGRPGAKRQAQGARRSAQTVCTALPKFPEAYVRHNFTGSGRGGHAGQAGLRGSEVTHRYQMGPRTTLEAGGAFHVGGFRGRPTGLNNTGLPRTLGSFPSFALDDTGDLYALFSNSVLRIGSAIERV